LSLEKTYLNIKEKFGRSLDLEPFCIVKAVDDHRNFWKPKNVRIILLAESHVHTLMDEYNSSMSYEKFDGLDGCPSNYVKLVYCLGYGENELSNLDTNSRTWQFWRIFTSCVTENPSAEFGKVETGETPDFTQRLQNKIELLNKLKENGIWLLDASIVALYKNNSKPSEKTTERIIKMCWEQHISQVIQEVKPEKIIVIGKGVFKILQLKLNRNNIDFAVQEQPRMLSSEKWKEYSEKYYKLCNS
jgi:hypothetical protein